jgi:TPR repeat protein
LEPSTTWANEPDLDKLRSANAVLDSDPQRALAEYQALAARGSVMSLANIGYIFEEGFGVEIDLAKAEEYYTRACDAGSVSALLKLGGLFLKTRQRESAVECFSKGVRHGDPRAMYWLAYVDLMNSDDRNQLEKAGALLERAAMLGHIQAERKLAKILISGRLGLSKVFHGFRLWFRSARAAAKLLAARDQSNEPLQDFTIQRITKLKGQSGSE